MASGLPRLAVDIDEHQSQAYEVPRSWLRAIIAGTLAALLACVGLAWIACFNKKVLEPTDFRHFLSTAGHLPMMHPAVRHTVNLKLSTRPGKHVRQHSQRLRSVTPIMQETEKEPTPKLEDAVQKQPSDVLALKPPKSREEMLNMAASAVERARSDGVTRFTLRLFLQRGDGIAPPDAFYDAGIMQFYARCSPMVRDLLSKLTPSIAGIRPFLQEQRLDESGVDGESVWIAQATKPEDDSIALVQPSAERLKDIRSFSAQAGQRSLIIVNPQWAELEDPWDSALDALSRKGGLLGSFRRTFLGGKGSLEKELSEMGFVDVFTLVQYPIRYRRVTLMLSYPYGWSVFYFDPNTQDLVKIISGSKTRPEYKEVEQALIDNGALSRYMEFQEIIGASG